MGAEEYLPDRLNLSSLREASRSCQGCDLYRHAEQTVFSAGPARSSIFLIGEQPGDQEDRRGEPFVGPAGRLLDSALDEAGIDRSKVYLTNAVKHFKFVPAERGKRRIHKTPGRTEIVACRPWLIAELAVVDPDIVVCLGATAAQAIHGPSFRVSKQRGELIDVEVDGITRRVVATVHPSAILRSRNRDEDFAAFVRDLEVVVAAAH
jgi:uracil-DNA glycosylase family protein